MLLVNSIIIGRVYRISCICKESHPKDKSDLNLNYDYLIPESSPKIALNTIVT